MQLPVKAHYAALAMLALAEKYDSREPLPARVIAREHSIPCQFLGQILQQLRASGLISSTRGAGGGFLLEKSPEQITIAEIVDIICPSTATTATLQNESALSQALRGVWDEITLKQREVLEAHTLSELLQRQATTNPMFYI